MAEHTVADVIATALNDAAKGARWVRLIPAGDIRGRDGRHFLLASPSRLVNAFQARNADLCIDYEHQSEEG